MTEAGGLSPYTHQIPGVFTAPMINVMGPDGPALVHRPWTDADMESALRHLPDHKASGQLSETFAENSCPLCLNSDCCS